MRLIVDLQACQTDSRDRGIGRYAMSLVQAMASALRTDDELIVAIDMADAGRARDVRMALRRRGVSAKVVAYGYPTTAHTFASTPARRLSGQLRSRFFAALKPDVVLLCSLFEFGTAFSTELDWAALAGTRVAVVGHDLIPLLFPEHYLQEGSSYTGFYRTRLEDLKKFDLVLCNSVSTQRDQVEHLGLAQAHSAMIGAGFDATLACTQDPVTRKRRLHDLGITRPFVLTVGNGDWRKNNLGALRAFADLPVPLRDAHDLVLTQAGDDVAQALAGEYATLRDHVHVLGKVDDATLALLYAECRVFYFPSYYEGFGFPVLEAMTFDAPVLSSNAGALPEVLHDAAGLFDPSAHADAVALLARALADGQFRDRLRRGAREHALTFTWARSAERALEALRSLATQAAPQRARVRVGAGAWPGGEDITLMADALADAGPNAGRALEDGLRAIERHGKRRLLIDITEIIRLDEKTGIQRVTREFLGGLAAIAAATQAFEVAPFYWTPDGVRHAHAYAHAHLGGDGPGVDGPVQVQPSDLVFMLDSSWLAPGRFDAFHQRVHQAAGEVVGMVYDLIPIRFPATCDPGMPPAFRAWLEHAVRTMDGFICISNATRDDLEAFMDDTLAAGASRPWTRTVHLGCDLSPAAAMGAPDKAVALRAASGSRPYLVALGTLEPRKDHATILDAFDALWARGDDVALMIVGKRGWHVDALATRITAHREYGHRLHWLQGGSDGDVRDLLEHSAGLIQASVWEGYGLPLVEAGSLGVPLVASDIAIFREIAGDSAVYFPVGDAAALADAVAAVVRGDASKPASIRSRGWREASADLARTLCA